MPTCFFIQGNGKKTDYTNGRMLDLDVSYKIIKKAAVSGGVMYIPLLDFA